MAASAAAVVTLGAGWFLGGSSGGGGGPSVVPATPALYQEHVATTAQVQLLPEALPLTPFVQSVSNR
jgi:uncharacterized membrane protein YfcA